MHIIMFVVRCDFDILVSSWIVDIFFKCTYVFFIKLVEKIFVGSLIRFRNCYCLRYGTLADEKICQRNSSEPLKFQDFV